MKKLLVTVIAVAALGAVATPALAQPGWRGINERQRELDDRIDRGVARGCLTRGEAIRLRAEFRTIAGLEVTYRASGGLNDWERRDLDSRMDRLAQDIRRQCRDDDDRGDRGDRFDWDSWGGWGDWDARGINQRQERLDRQIDRGVRRGCLSRREADRLRDQWRYIARLERTYRMSGGGLNRWERSDLDRRFDRLAQDIRRQCRDDDRRRY